MTDILLFMQHGWKNIWRQNTIWLFSVLPILDQTFRAIQIKHELNLLWSFLYLAESFISIILSLVSFIGVPYLAYYFSIGKSVTVQETLLGIRKFLRRVIGCSCFGFLLLSPLFIWVLAVSINTSTHTIQIPDKTVLALLLLSLFSAVPEFTLIGFFASDLNIHQSIKEAWTLFTNHFTVLATLGIVLTIIFKLYSSISGTLTVLIQSGFDTASLSNLNYINPSSTLSKNVLFVLINGIGQTVFTPFSTSVFVLAYLNTAE